MTIELTLRSLSGFQFSPGSAQAPLHAKYAVTPRPTPPGIIPICEECDVQFVSREDGEWLLYDRADA
jgi:hypothetical protein